MIHEPGHSYITRWIYNELFNSIHHEPRWMSNPSPALNYFIVYPVSIIRWPWSDITELSNATLIYQGVAFFLSRSRFFYQGVAFIFQGNGLLLVFFQAILRAFHNVSWASCGRHEWWWWKVRLLPCKGVNSLRKLIDFLFNFLDVKLEHVTLEKKVCACVCLSTPNIQIFS